MSELTQVLPAPIAPTHEGQLDLRRHSQGTRQMSGVLTLPPAMLKQLAIRYIDRPDVPQVLTVIGEKTEGQPRFQATVSAGVAQLSQAL